MEKAVNRNILIHRLKILRAATERLWGNVSTTKPEKALKQISTLRASINDGFLIY